MRNTHHGQGGKKDRRSAHEIRSDRNFPGSSQLWKGTVYRPAWWCFSCNRPLHEKTHIGPVESDVSLEHSFNHYYGAGSTIAARARCRSVRCRTSSTATGAVVAAVAAVAAVATSGDATRPTSASGAEPDGGSGAVEKQAEALVSNTRRAVRAG